MDHKKMLEAHQSVKKCLAGDCSHRGVSKCMDSIADAHQVIGKELGEDTEKMIRHLQGEIVKAKLDQIDKSRHDVVQKSLQVVWGAEPVEVD